MIDGSIGGGITSTLSLEIFRCTLLIGDDTFNSKLIDLREIGDFHIPKSNDEYV